MFNKIFITGLTFLLSYVAGAQQKPNIIFILADDLGRGDLPLYGNGFNEAPHLQAMAHQGALYTNAYAAAPVCSPTRASILSGQYPARVGILDFIPGLWRPYESVIVPQNRTQYLPPEVITIGEAMQQKGYATGYFGKWHLGDSSIYHPSQQGFKEAFVGQGHYGVTFKPPYPSEKGTRLSDAMAGFADDFIDAHQKEPFFLFLSAFDVHLPLDADTALIAKYLNKPKITDYPCNPIYAAMIEHLDIMVGRILKKVKDAGLEERTMIVFFSDNGGLDRNYKMQALPVLNKQHFLKDDSTLYLATNNIPFRGVKGNLYEGGIRVPMIVKYPKWKTAVTIDDIVTSVDFFPSFVGLAGGALPTGQVFDGINIFGSNQQKERPVFWHYPVFHHGVPGSAVRLGKWKLIRNLVDNSEELYNLETDVSEQFNLANTAPQHLKKLSALLDDWLKETRATLPVPNPDFDEKRRLEWTPHPSKIKF